MDRRRVVMMTAGVALATVLGTGSAIAADQDVAISGFTFSPSTVTINVGDSVTWTNSDAQAHTATGNGWDTGDLGNGESGSITFQSAGTFDYQCTIHPAMTGRVVVRAAGATTPPTDTSPVPTPADDGWLAATLAFLGAAMIVGTLVADRRFRERHPN
jgi:plastocyanin